MTARRTHAARMPNARSSSIRATRQRSTASPHARIWSFCISWTGRGAISWCRRRATVTGAAPLRRSGLAPRYAAALDGVAACTHLVVLYFMDRARRDLLVQAPRHGDRRGTFALRSPVRPNPVAMSVVRLVGIDGTILKVVGLDCLDGTPLLDLKPYFPSVDSVPDATVG